MDPGSDVILAYKHNGRLLTPDHGFPIRIIIPGFIGGRMVRDLLLKWMFFWRELLFPLVSLAGKRIPSFATLPCITGLVHASDSFVTGTYSL